MSKICRATSLGFFLLHVSVGVAAFDQTVVDKLVGRYPAGSIQSTDLAELALVELTQTRLVVESGTLADERQCYPKFFTTVCLEHARERRRTAMAALRQIEVEAHTFKRREVVSQRDRVLAQQRADDEAEALRRDTAVLEAAQRTHEQAQGAQDSSPSDAEIIADQKRRADKVNAYDKKQRDALQRQRAVENKRAAN